MVCHHIWHLMGPSNGCDIRCDIWWWWPVQNVQKCPAMSSDGLKWSSWYLGDHLWIDICRWLSGNARTRFSQRPRTPYVDVMAPSIWECAVTACQKKNISHSKCCNFAWLPAFLDGFFRVIRLTCIFLCWVCAFFVLLRLDLLWKIMLSIGTCVAKKTKCLT